jgi:hypothetical protein
MNFCGQPGARVDADRSIYFKEGHDRETLIFRLSNLILWYAPQKHYKRIQRVWVDEIINAPRWKGFIAQQENEWTGFTLYVSTRQLGLQFKLSVTGVNRYVSCRCQFPCCAWRYQSRRLLADSVQSRGVHVGSVFSGFARGFCAASWPKPRLPPSNRGRRGMLHLLQLIGIAN